MLWPVSAETHDKPGRHGIDEGRLLARPRRRSRSLLPALASAGPAGASSRAFPAVCALLTADAARVCPRGSASAVSEELEAVTPRRRRGLSRPAGARASTVVPALSRRRRQRGHRGPAAVSATAGRRRARRRRAGLSRDPAPAAAPTAAAAAAAVGRCARRQREGLGPDPDPAAAVDDDDPAAAAQLRRAQDDVLHA